MTSRIWSAPTRCARRFCLGLCLLAPLVAVGAPAALGADDTKAKDPSEKLVKGSKVTATRDIYKDERDDFRAAQRAWSAGKSDEYRKLKAKLRDYPLIDALEFAELESRLTQLPLADIDKFLTTYGESLSSARIRYRVLPLLAAKGRWQDYLRYFHPAMQEADYRCNYLYARLSTGDQSALDEVAPLWNIDKTQTKTCDPLFARWRQAGGQTADLVWERLLKVSARQDKPLAGYLARQLPPAYQTAATRVGALYTNPRLIIGTKWPTQTTYERELILLGIERLARTDAASALKVWQSYSANLPPPQARAALKNLALRHLWQKDADTARQLALDHPDIRDAELIEALLRERLRALDFASLSQWLDFLPQETQTHERWRYWRARSLEQSGNPQDQQAANTIYSALADTRSYYGFAAADKLGRPYQLQDKPVTFTKSQLRAVQTNASVKRAREYLLLNDTLAANREWSYALRKFDTHDRAIAGRVAKSWGWDRQGIQAMIQANHWDDLTVRFPTEYSSLVEKNAKATALNQQFIFSIIRQESAFIPDVRSPVGATGLMQLMPATAAETARRNKIAYSPSDLTDPAKNIALGSRFLKQMMDRFAQNRLLTAAAYNAGPGRVNQWLTPQRNLPHDVWVETIPFRETRGYVQNVLAFGVIYAYRLGQKPVFMTNTEQQQTL